jgi:hypothetical protein
MASKNPSAIPAEGFSRKEEGETSQQNECYCAGGLVTGDAV